MAPSQFKGVQSLENGTWGARICLMYKLFWLGTYASEVEAAISYDRAALKLQREDSLNFHRSNYTAEERSFQSQYSAEEILSMLKLKTYSSMLMSFISYNSSSMEVRSFMNERGISYQLIFQKELGHTDVTRECFLIPEEYAIPHFPLTEYDGCNSYIIFYDRFGHSYPIRFSYWLGAQSFMFTTGWGDFLKKNNLKEKDKVTFFRCWYQGDAHEREFYIIDVHKSNKESAAAGMNTLLDMGSGSSVNMEFEAGTSQGFKLFGVEMSG